MDPKLKKKRYDHTKEREKYLKRKGFEIESIWECDFKAMNIYSFQYLPKFTQNYLNGLKDVMLHIMNGDLYGMAEADIHVQEHLYPIFSEMSPLFCTTEVPFDVIGEHMQEYTMSMKHLPILGKL